MKIPRSFSQRLKKIKISSIFRKSLLKLLTDFFSACLRLLSSLFKKLSYRKEQSIKKFASKDLFNEMQDLRKYFWKGCDTNRDHALENAQDHKHSRNIVHQQAKIQIDTVHEKLEMIKNCIESNPKDFLYMLKNISQDLRIESKLSSFLDNAPEEDSISNLQIHDSISLSCDFLLAIYKAISIKILESSNGFTPALIEVDLAKLMKQLHKKDIKTQNITCDIVSYFIYNPNSPKNLQKVIVHKQYHNILKQKMIFDKAIDEVLQVVVLNAQLSSPSEKKVEDTSENFDKRICEEESRKFMEILKLVDSLLFIPFDTMKNFIYIIDSLLDPNNYKGVSEMLAALRAIENENIEYMIPEIYVASFCTFLHNIILTLDQFNVPEKLQNEIARRTLIVRNWETDPKKGTQPAKLVNALASALYYGKTRPFFVITQDDNS